MTFAVAISLALAAAPNPRPTVDLAAMREAMGVSTDTDGTPFPSAASYAHFLQARLSHHDGDHHRSLDELRLALASDDASPYLMTELAEQYARMSELERAEGQLKKVLERYPDYQPAQLLMGRVLFEGQKITRAKGFLQRAIKLKPTDPDPYLVLTQLWLDQNKLDEAMKVVDQLGVAVPGEPVGFRRLGLALAERGDGARAERLLTRAVERDPGDLEAWGTLAKIYEASNRLTKAIEALERAIERDPENRELLLSAGRIALRLDRESDARAYFEQLLSLGRDPEWAVKVAFSYLATHRLAPAAEVLDRARAGGQEPRLHFYAGLVHERQHHWQKAIEAFELVTKGMGELFNEARLHRALCLSSAGQHKPALELLRAVAADKPDLAGLEPATARALERSGQLREAETLLTRALAKEASGDVLEAITGFYQRQNRLGDAVALLGSAAAKTPRDEGLLYALALAWDKKGDWQKAVERMRQVLELNPANPGAANFVGYTLADHNVDLDEALRLVTRALEARPESAAFLDSVGWVHFKRGETEKAAEFLERAVDTAPDEPTLFEHLGEISNKLGRRARAQEAYTHALELLAANPEAADRPLQRVDLERKLKLLTPAAAPR
jgi:tetratricopeptide (TPR) repeat protein